MEQNFFSLLPSLSQPDLERYIAGMMFFNILNFFAIFFLIYLPESGRNGIQDENFFLPFPAYLNPVWIEIMLE